jgi:hypothetical protein
VIGTGGLLARAPDAALIMRAALERCDDRSLTPRRPKLAVDAHYVLAAAGLLAQVDTGAALALMRQGIDVSQRSTPEAVRTS